MPEKMNRREDSRSRSNSRNRSSQSTRAYNRSYDKRKKHNSSRRKRSINRYSNERCRRRSHSRSRSHTRSRCRSVKKNRSRSFYSSSRSYSSCERDYDRRRSYSRSPAQRRGFYGSRERPIQSRCLGVFGLNVYTTQKNINQIFSKFGPIKRVQLVMDAKTGQSRGFCFVYFENAADAKVAKEQCSGMEIDERRIRVDYSITQRPHTPTPGIYMGKPSRHFRERNYYGNNRNMDYSRDRNRYKGRDSPYSYRRGRKKQSDRSSSRSISPRNRRYH